MAIPMKTDLMKFTTESYKNLRGIRAGLITTLIFFHLLPKAWSVDLFWADDSTVANAGTGPWTPAQFFNQWSDTSTHTSKPDTLWTNGPGAKSLHAGVGSGG